MSYDVSDVQNRKRINDSKYDGHLEVGSIVTVLVYNLPLEMNAFKLVRARVVEVGDCRWEITESKASQFKKYIETADIHIKQVLSLINGDIKVLPDENKYKTYAEIYNLHRIFNKKYDGFKILGMKSSCSAANKKCASPYSMVASAGINLRRNGLIKLISDSVCPDDLKNLFRYAYDVFKKSQIIKVQYIDYHPYSYAYYVAHNCSSDKLVLIAENLVLEYPNPIADEHEDGIVPVEHLDRIISRLPDMYSLEQITEINSWLTHGMLSTYLLNPGMVQDICTHPLIGNDFVWHETAALLEKQYQILFDLAKPLETDIHVYRGSPHYKSHPIRIHSVFATSTNEFVANGFGGKAKIVKLPAGTRVLDLTRINKKEREILVFPSTKESNLIIEPVNVEGNERNKRFTYRIRNPMNTNRNVIKVAGKPAARRRTRRRR